MTSYTSLEVVRQISGIATSTMDDTTMSSVMSMAISLFNLEVNIEVGGAGEDYELLRAADEDDTNTIFYTKHFPLADMDGDATFSPNTDIFCYDDLKQNLPSSVTVSTMDYSTGKITLSAATTDSVYARYQYTSYEKGSKEFENCFAYFCAMLCWDNLINVANDVRLGDLSVSRKNRFEGLYKKALSKLTGPLMTVIKTRPNAILTSAEYQDELRGEEN